jgi:cell migration-inducing and hyaluronan-binding protein
MSTKYRSFLVVSLLPIVLLGSVVAVGQAREGTSPTIKQTLWSDPATWPDGKVPAAGDKVTIERGKDVILDVSPPPLSGLHIEGQLSFSDKADLELTTEWILLNGELQIGTHGQCPWRRTVWNG